MGYGATSPLQVSDDFVLNHIQHLSQYIKESTS